MAREPLMTDLNWMSLSRHDLLARGSLFSRFVLLMLVAATLLLMTVIPMSANAQNNELISPIPQARVADMTAAHTQRIDQIRQRPTTASLDLVTLNVGALRDT